MTLTDLCSEARGQGGLDPALSENPRAPSTWVLHSLELSWYTMDGGGLLSYGGGYCLRGTIGQPDTGQSQSSGGEYSLSGGFWPGVALRPPALFSDGFESGDVSAWSGSISR
jgi:hypothetical protein